MTLSRKLTVELIGAFFLMFTVGMAVTAGSLAPLAIGSVLMVMVFAGGRISGARYDPAVTTAVLVRRGMAVGLGYAPHAPAAVAGTGTMLVVELLLTFALAYVVLNVATARDTANNSFYGLAIGSTLATGAFAAGSLSGGAFNPAVAVGASVLGMFAWSHIWICLLAEFAGGAAAAGVFLFGVFLFTQADEPVSTAQPDPA